MRNDKYIQGLKRELAGRGARSARAADEILRELAANGERVEMRGKAPKAPGPDQRAKKPARKSDPAED